LGHFTLKPLNWTISLGNQGDWVVQCSLFVYNKMGEFTKIADFIFGLGVFRQNLFFV
jgi:hypothetical protein